MTIAYRDTPALCPICAARMEEQPIEGGTIRTCESCGGVWVDGGGSDLAQAATQAHVPAAPPTTEVATTGPCPTCGTRLDPVTLRDAALLRCASCRGTFIPHAALGAAMWLTPEDETPPPEGIDGLKAWVRYLWRP